MTSEDESRAPTPYLIKRLELALRFRLDLALADSGVTATQYTLLSDVHSSREITGADLARRWHLRPQSISEALAGLEAAGLIRRRVSPHHKRRRLVEVSAEGEALLARVAPRVRALDTEMLSALGEPARSAFRSDLVRVRRALEGR